ncbi:uncharacterized protein N7473_009073 [Penicillium subrubescens]|uniref:uncharacterized protein n=1 Tax=Penicillium subrubescens TaxID=1316194 RepID=UPI002544F120|nr:uncharacterized protein N7473_009073 [Penicillium subrubescens]KAJ5886399.1 hypothetical protein N7473_009073 [Penicillium subrubescens]
MFFGKLFRDLRWVKTLGRRMVLGNEVGMKETRFAQFFRWCGEKDLPWSETWLTAYDLVKVPVTDGWAQSDWNGDTRLWETR